MAHLHSVRLRGFKTFAKPTELVFEPGVTVIIGPNGSGKSNIADAVLWVLGEQSPGNLRGRSMQDVIFSGPGGRKSSAVAEVSLVFDNGCGSLPLDCEQLEVTRRLTRDTGSEYRLNGNGCRLLDVQDLVGALGLGREMHSVISQGKVEALLNSTPEARRAMVEEAAGLGRFKKRRERALAKLERTRQNLLRVADIEREVKAALRPLRQQVAAAERFAEATEEWAVAKGRSVLHTLVCVQTASHDTARELGRIEDRRLEIERELADLRGQRAAEEELAAAATHERERLSAVFHGVRAEAAHVEGRAVSLRQRLARVEGELDRARRRRDLARSEAASVAARLEEAMAGTADEARLARVSGWAEKLKAALAESLPAYRKAGTAEDETKDTVFELEAARSRALQERDFLRREVDERSRVGTELSGLADEAVARLEGLESEAAGLEKTIAEARQAAQQVEADLRKAAADRSEARADADEAARAEAAIGEVLAGLEARQAVLADMLVRKEGVPAGSRELLTAEEGCRSLTEVLTVREGYERAFAAALGPIAQAVVVPEGVGLSRSLQVTGPFEAILESGGQGSESQRLRPPEGTVDLWDVVSGPDVVVDALRKIVPSTAVLVQGESLGEGGSNRGAGSWRLVSRSGELFVDGLHAARRQEVGAETLFRARNELESASREREALLVEREAARAATEQAAALVVKAEHQFRRQEERLHLAERTLAAHLGDHDLHQRRLEEARLQCGELQGRQDRETGLSEQMVAELTAVEEAMIAGEADLEAARASLRAVQGEVETLRRTVGALEEKKGQAALAEVRLRERCRAHESERSRALSQREAARLETVRWERRVEALEKYLPALGQLLVVAERLAERVRTVSTEVESLVEAARVRTPAGGAVHEWVAAEARLQQEYQAATGRSTELQVDQARLEDRKSLAEEELAELRRRHLSPRGLTPADVEGEDDESLDSAVERAERRRERIGPVNPLAEEECAEMEERATFLAEQRRDLEASLAQLGDVIAELDEHIERTFGEIFEATREHFSAVVASVFPGARGSLKLTEAKAAPASEGVALEGEEEDGGEQARGIVLEVRFPNKSPRSLSLLSGGEKAMTAIAFLFSLFLARPCPFYILDEVEASLDDINIRRFLTLVRKYRERTQFIIITHQRQTMEVADTLYGVTLESDGTSRVLSRRLTAAKGA